MLRRHAANKQIICKVIEPIQPRFDQNLPRYSAQYRLLGSSKGLCPIAVMMVAKFVRYFHFIQGGVKLAHNFVERRARSGVMHQNHLSTSKCDEISRPISTYNVIHRCAKGRWFQKSGSATYSHFSSPGVKGHYFGRVIKMLEYR